MQEITTVLAERLKVNVQQVKNALDLLHEGATIPFIARYRKNITGNLDEEALQIIHHDFIYLQELAKRKTAIITILKEKELLSQELEKAIFAAKTKAEVEQIYAPFKEGRKTKATEAIALGLKPLAENIFSANEENFNPFQEAKKYLTKEVTSTEMAIEKAKLIIAELMNQDVKARDMAYEQILNYGFIVSNKKAKAIDEKETFINYYSYKEKVKNIPNHRILAINRGEKLKILQTDFEVNEQKIRYDLNNHFFKIKSTGKILLSALEDALKRLIMPALKRQIQNQLVERASEAAIKLFANNLETMLMAPAIKNKRIIAIDPGFTSGCKIAAIDQNGLVLAVNVIKPHPPFKQEKTSAEIIAKLIKEHQINLIVIGNGTASRETERFIAKFIKAYKLSIPFSIVSEVGASVYSASAIAIKEFPNLLVEQRSAIHIGRKFQDPLNELVKIDPRAIGIGQYQHDVNQSNLKEALVFKVNKVVNQVGVDVNSATLEILSYISGMNQKIATNLLTERLNNNGFKNRDQIKKVKGLGPKSYQQAIGFLRINDSTNFYDKTAIHPESYKLADQIVKHLALDLTNIDLAKLNEINITNLAKTLDSNIYDVELIINSLKEPSKDIRADKPGPILKSDILEFKDVKVNMILSGEVQNITDFGAFIYVGLKEAVFVHISKIASHFIKHPSDVLKPQQHVEVKIIEINLANKQIKGQIV